MQILHYEVKEVYDYHDFPILFVGEDGRGHLFLVMCAEEGQLLTRWLAVAVTVTKLEAIQSGQVLLREVFQVPEVYEHWDFYDGCPTVTSIRSGDSLTDEDLPGAQARLSLKPGGN